MLCGSRRLKWGFSTIVERARWSKIIGKCKNLIDMEVNEEGVDQQFRVFWVYGLTDFDEKQGVWKMISERARSIKVSWLCIGDFNDILFNYEKDGGNLRAARKIRSFKEMIEECNLIDLGGKGQRFTWMNKKKKVL